MLKSSADMATMSTPWSRRGTSGASSSGSGDGGAAALADGDVDGDAAAGTASSGSSSWDLLPIWFLFAKWSDVPTTEKEPADESAGLKNSNYAMGPMVKRKLRY
jgi:hypothetical protein